LRDNSIKAGEADVPAASEAKGAADDLELEADSLGASAQFKTQPKGPASHRPPTFRTKLTNQFSSGNSNMQTAMSANLGDMFTNQMMGAFQKNAEYDPEKQALKCGKDRELLYDHTSCANS